MDKKFNAIKHGLLAKQSIINPEESRPFNKLAKKLLYELQPNSSVELILAEQVVLNYWRMRRYLKLENELFLFIGESKYGYKEVNFMDEFTDFVRKNPSFDVLMRHYPQIMKAFYRSLHEYRNIKSNNNSNKQD